MKFLFLLILIISSQVMAGNPEKLFDCNALSISNNPWGTANFNINNKSKVSMVRDDYRTKFQIGSVELSDEDIYQIAMLQGESGSDSFNIIARANAAGNGSARISFIPGGKGTLYYSLNQGPEKLVAELNCKAIKLYKN